MHWLGATIALGFAAAAGVTELILRYRERGRDLAAHRRRAARRHAPLHLVDSDDDGARARCRARHPSSRRVTRR